MCPGLSADLQLMDDSRKTAIINKELARLNIDVAYLQETRLADSGSLMERDYTFFWQDLSQDKPRQYDVGFAVRNSLIATTETSSGGSSRILALRMKMSAGFVNIISTYDLTLTSTPEAKDQFYEALQETLSGIPSSEGIYLLGDFNARVGTDWQAWPTCLVHFGVGRMNENGQRLLELCCHYGLCITATLSVRSCTKCLRDTLGPTTDTSLTSSTLGERTSAVYSTQEAITALTVTRTTSSLQARSG